jgi:hypothetical protein
MSEDKDLKQQRLEIHRELQLLRAQGWKAKKGQGRKKTAWLNERVRKLDQVQRRAK